MKKIKNLLLLSSFCVLMSFNSFATQNDQTNTTESIVETTVSDTNNYILPTQDDLHSYNTIGEKTRCGYTLIKIVDGTRVYLVDPIEGENAGTYATEYLENFGPIYENEIDDYVKQFNAVRQSKMSQNPNNIQNVEENSDGEPALPELNVAKKIKLNVNVVFDNVKMEDSKIYQVKINVTGPLRYRGEEEEETDYLEKTLLRENNMTYSGDIDMKDNEFTVTASLPDDRLQAYTIQAEGEDFASKTFKTEGDNYTVTFHINQKENAVLDANLTPTISKNDEKFFDGSYANDLRKENEKKEVVVKKNKMNPWVIVIGGTLFLVGIGVGGFLYIKKLREDD